MMPANRKIPQAILKVDLQSRRGTKSKSEVADALGVAIPTLTHIAAGCGVHLDVALRVAKYYDLRVDEIWGLRGTNAKT